MFPILHDLAPSWRVEPVSHLYHLAYASWVGSVLCRHPAQRLTTAGEELDGLDHDLSDLSDLSDLDRHLPDLSDVDYLDRYLSFRGVTISLIHLGKTTLPSQRHGGKPWRRYVPGRYCSTYSQQKNWAGRLDRTKYDDTENIYVS